MTGECMGGVAIGGDDVGSESFVGGISRVESSNDFSKLLDVKSSDVPPRLPHAFEYLGELQLSSVQLVPRSISGISYSGLAPTSRALTSFRSEMSLEGLPSEIGRELLDVGDENFGSFCDVSTRSNEEKVAVESVESVWATAVIEVGCGDEERYCRYSFVRSKLISTNYEDELD